MKKRRYKLKTRARQVSETRKRIVEATVALHEEIGPHLTTISAIAERAGVERLTVYRHLPTERAILEACSASWISQNPPPDPETWQAEPDPRKRAETALKALMLYYSGTSRMFGNLYRDVSFDPDLAEIMQDFEAYLDAITDDLATAWKTRRKRRPEFRAIIRHAVRYSTWASLHAERVADSAKAYLLVRWMESLADEKKHRTPAH